MKVCEGCKLFGAYEALAGIRGGVVLFHSVTGCNFGTLTMEIENRMNRVNQCCTVINENDVIFGGETSVEAALRSVWELYHPQVIFVISGCISSMVGDDVQSCARQVNLPCPVICISAPGFAGGIQDGYEEAANALFSLMEKTRKKEKIRKETREKEDGITVNLLGLGSGDVRLWQDLLALESIFDGQVRILMSLSECEVEQVKNAPLADCNLVFGRGIGLARKMEEAFGIPYVELHYPYGITGEEAVYQAIEQSCGVQLCRGNHREKAVKQLKRIYAYLQALYGSSAAVIGSRARANGMRRFLESELGMDVVCFAIREELEDLDEFYDRVRESEAALIFGSSFEAQIAREQNIPLVRYDYPVFDRVCITKRPYATSEGMVYLIEDILNELMAERRKEGALYQ